VQARVRANIDAKAENRIDRFIELAPRALKLSPGKALFAFRKMALRFGKDRVGIYALRRGLRPGLGRSYALSGGDDQ
jgi:hypothetical protein